MARIVVGMGIPTPESKVRGADMTECTCKHGAKMRRNDLNPGGWSGGVSRCECCGSIFVYLDSGSVNFNTGESSSRCWSPKNKCILCGGSYVEFHTPGNQPKDTRVRDAVRKATTG